MNALHETRDNIHLAQSFVAAQTLETFQGSKLHVYATVRAIEIISEASRRRPDDLRARHPHLPWRAIRDSGNVYRHRYDDVSEARIWIVVQERLPALLDAVEAELDQPGGDPAA